MDFEDTLDDPYWGDEGEMTHDCLPFNEDDNFIEEIDPNKPSDVFPPSKRICLSSSTTVAKGDNIGGHKSNAFRRRFGTNVNFGTTRVMNSQNVENKDRNETSLVVEADDIFNDELVLCDDLLSEDECDDIGNMSNGGIPLLDTSPFGDLTDACGSLKSTSKVFPRKNIKDLAGGLSTQLRTFPGCSFHSLALRSSDNLLAHLRHSYSAQRHDIEDSKFIHSHPPRDCADILLVRPLDDEWEAMYIEVDPSMEDMLCDINESKRIHRNQRSCFLGKPIGAIIEQFEKEEYAKIAKQLIVPKDADTGGTKQTISLLDNRQAKSSQRLWVDKYRPKGFIDLLSDEEVNRESLKWLKSFSDKFANGEIDSEMSKQLQEKDLSHQPKSAANANFSGTLISPQPRILLLSGPPGCGKTTLAHIIAHKAGYNAEEINASDDRTKDKMERAMRATIFDSGVMSAFKLDATTKTVPFKKRITQRRRQNLLILDEIDGADREAIARIVSLIEETDSKGRHVIQRPIICCCNDQFVKVLRPLRVRAKRLVVTMEKERTVKRLQDICDSENVKTDFHFLTKLRNHFKDDMRATVNTLQLLSALKRSDCPNAKHPSCRQKRPPAVRLEVSDLQKLSNEKDQDVHEMQLYNVGYSNNQMRVNKLEDVANLTLSYGNSFDIKLVLSIIHDNFPLVPTTDIRCHKISYLMEHIVEADCLQSGKNCLHNSDLGVWGLLSVLLYGRCHFVPATSVNGHLGQRPRVYALGLDAFCNQIGKFKQGSLRQVIDAVPPGLRPSVASTSFRTDVVQSMLPLCIPNKKLTANAKFDSAFHGYRNLPIKPGLGIPLNSLRHPLSVWHHLLEVMTTFNLRYSDSSLQLGVTANASHIQWFMRQSSYRLEPPLHILTIPFCSGFYDSYTTRISLPGRYTGKSLNPLTASSSSTTSHCGWHRTSAFHPRACQLVNLQLMLSQASLGDNLLLFLRNGTLHGFKPDFDHTTKTSDFGTHALLNMTGRDSSDNKREQENVSGSSSTQGSRRWLWDRDTKTFGSLTSLIQKCKNIVNVVDFQSQGNAMEKNGQRQSSLSVGQSKHYANIIKFRMTYLDGNARAVKFNTSVLNFLSNFYAHSKTSHTSSP